MPRRQLVAAVVVATFLSWFGHPSAGLVAATAIVLVAQLGLVRPRSAQAFARLVEAFGRWVGHVLGIVLLVPVVGLFALVRLGHVVLRHDVLTPHGGRGWSTVSPPPMPERLYAAEPPRPPLGGAVGRVLPSLTVVLALLLVLDLGIGWATSERSTVPRSASPTAGEGIDAAAPPLGGLSWAQAHVEDLEALQHDYVPFVFSRVQDHAGQTVTVDGGLRATYEPDDLPADAPEVWILGGATVFGEGQRDEHTIASELARVAEQEGHALRVLNLGVSGDVLWQQWHRMEQRLAAGGRPDVVLFYGGGNDLVAQVQAPHVDPTIRNREVAAEVVRQEPPPSAFSWWMRTSASVRLARTLAGEVLGRPAAAGAMPSNLGGDPVDNTVAIHQRGMAMAELVAEGSGAELFFVWQAVRSSGDPDDGFVQAAQRLAPAVVDLTGALASSPESFIDDLRTDERGAAVVAAALWRLVQPTLEAP